MMNEMHAPKSIVMKRKQKKSEKMGEGKKLIKRAALAMKQEFYLDATWILATLIEKKLGKILEKLEPSVQKQGVDFAQSVKRIKYLHVSAKHPDLVAHFQLGLFDEIRNWKNLRNEILKDIQQINVSRPRMERLANTGLKLYKELTKAAKSFKSAESSSASEGKSSG